MDNHNHNSLPNGNAAAEEELGVGSSFLFINPSSNWENSMDQNDPFESALSSMVSSPVTSSYSYGGCGGENINVVRELIGRLGGICNSPHSSYNNHSANTSCYTTPLNSPPKLNLSIRDHQMISGNSGSHFAANPGFVAPFPSDQGFAERAASYSCFTNKKSGGGLTGRIGSMNDADFGHRLVPKLDSVGVSSNQFIKIPGSQMDIQNKKWSNFSTPENSGFGDSMDISSLTEQITTSENVMTGPNPNEDNPRKRKLVPKEKTKEPTSLNSSKDANVASENTDRNAKRSKSKEENGLDKDGTKVKAESNGSDKTAAAGDGDGDGKDNINAEPPKVDYIHVRARRGQATDAHSLAERVRREKISEKMTFLQDLVPGCNKVTGKAVMLDEIINYVQSLQHQVEFLSMKLATINPTSDFNSEARLSKDVIQTQGPLHHIHNMYPSDASATEFRYYPSYPQGPNVQSAMPNGIDVQYYSMNHLNAANGRDTSIQLPASDNFSELSSQVTAFWGDDLHSVVQMGLGQNETQISMGSRQQLK